MKRIFSRSALRRLNIFHLFLLLPWMTLHALSLQTVAGDLGTLTVNFSMMSPHVGQDLWLAVIDTETMNEVGRVHVVAELTFVVEIANILEDGKSYHVDFFVDYNQSGYYDPPGTDHAWRLELNNVLGNETLDFAHQVAFTDVEWKHRLRLSFTGMSANIGQELNLYVRDLDSGSYLDTVRMSSIADPEFNIDSYAIVPGGTYMLDFFADLNGNGMYDAPPVDQAWRFESGQTTGDLDLEFSHNQAYTDIFAPLGVLSEAVPFRVSVYPNPTKQFLLVSMEALQGSRTSISILNMAGNAVLSQTFPGSGTKVELDLAALPAGIYILQLDNSDHRSFSRFIKL
jgi:hypothetical protein